MDCLEIPEREVFKVCPDHRETKEKSAIMVNSVLLVLLENQASL